jgi:hypothetical protein
MSTVLSIGASLFFTAIIIWIIFLWWTGRYT